MRPLTRSCFLLLLGRLFLLALSFVLGICLPSVGSPPFPLHAPSPILLSLAKVQLSPILTLFLLMIWYSELTAVFLYLVARVALAYLATALSVALRPLFPLSAGPVCSSFSAEACSILNGSPDTRFSRRTTRMMSWPDEVRFLRPPQSFVVSLLSLVSTLVFSRTGGVLRLSYRLFAALLAILPAAPADTRPRTPFTSFCTVQLRTLCVARSLATLCLSTTSGPGPGELPGFWGSMVFHHALIRQKGFGQSTTDFAF